MSQHDTQRPGIFLFLIGALCFIFGVVVGNIKPQRDRTVEQSEILTVGQPVAVHRREGDRWGSTTAPDDDWHRLEVIGTGAKPKELPPGKVWHLTLADGSMVWLAELDQAGE